MFECLNIVIPVRFFRLKIDYEFSIMFYIIKLNLKNEKFKSYAIKVILIIKNI